ncbi:MAG: protein-S-isoprenylcysteine O-methyltransferase Ste14 [Vicingaceae bacterium]|jgi:protein-S-isoprenylcysteine O-methyltransferase Ste14
MSILSWVTIFQITSIIIAIWAGWELKKSKLSVFPELKDGAQLINTGPYHIIRHPIYSALLLFFLPTVVLGEGSVVLGEGSIVILVFFVLLTTLIFKMKYEEKILKYHFAEYEQYSKKSFYLIPFIY